MAAGRLRLESASQVHVWRGCQGGGVCVVCELREVDEMVCVCVQGRMCVYGPQPRSDIPPPSTCQYEVGPATVRPGAAPPPFL